MDNLLEEGEILDLPDPDPYEPEEDQGDLD